MWKKFVVKIEQKSRWKVGPKHARWKGETASISAFHKYLRSRYGTPNYCENKGCKNKSRIYEWCLKRDRKYSRRRCDYLRMCRACHRAYDLTPERKAKIIENFWWKLGIRNPNLPLTQDKQ